MAVLNNMQRVALYRPLDARITLLFGVLRRRLVFVKFETDLPTRASDGHRRTGPSLDLIKQSLHRLF